MSRPDHGDLVIALDSGSQSSRALLFTLEGEVLSKGQRAHAPMLHPAPGAVEQDPADIRACLFAATRECLDSWGGDRSRLRAGALTTQRNTTLLLGHDGAPIRDLISWLDRRSADLGQERSLGLRALHGLLGERAVLPRLLARSQGRRLRQQDPEALRDARWMVPLEAWLHQELCGRLVSAPGGIIGVWPVDVKKRTWSEIALLYKLLALDRGQFCDVVEACSELGKVSAAAAEACGLPEGMPLYACGGDKQAESLGAGVRPQHRDIAAVSLGTGSSVGLTWDRPIESSSYRWITNASSEPGAWALEYMIFRGMWTATWFAKQFARDLEERATAEGRPVEALLCDEAAEAPPGSDGLMIWPRWSPSLQHPEEAGTLVGLRETHSRGHVFRALLEGIAYDLRRGIGILEGAVKTRVRELRVGGGGARSELAVSILADVTGLPVRRPPMEELSALGAAMVAAVGAGLHGSMDEASCAMVPDAPLLEPDGDRADLYNKRYQGAFEPGLESMRGLWRALR